MGDAEQRKAEAVPNVEVLASNIKVAMAAV